MGFLEELQNLADPKKKQTTPKVDLSFVNKIPAAGQSKAPITIRPQTSVSLVSNKNTPNVIDKIAPALTIYPTKPQPSVLSNLQKLATLPPTKISQGTPDPVQEQRQFLSKVPVIGKYLTGVGPQGPSKQLYEKGSLQQSLVEGGIINFLMEGFNKKVNPTRAEMGERIFTRYEKLGSIEQDPKRRLEAAIADTMKNTVTGAKTLEQLKDTKTTLTKREKDALFWVNTLEDAFAVLDAPVFAGTTKVPKEALLDFLKTSKKAEEIAPRLREIGIAEDVVDSFATKIANSKNELQISRYLEAAKKVEKGADSTPYQTKALDELDVAPAKTLDSEITPPAPVATAPKTLKRVDEVDALAPERFFRSADNGARFDEIPAEETIPALVKQDLDTFVAKTGPNEFSVIEGKSGRQIGESAENVAQAIKNAKVVLQDMPEQEIKNFVDNSPVSPRYTQVEPEPIKQIDEKSLARRNQKLEDMAVESPTYLRFLSRTGVTEASLNATVKKQGFETAKDYYKTKRSIKKSPEERAKIATEEAELTDKIRKTSTPEELKQRAEKISKTDVKLTKEQIEQKRLEIEFTKDAIDSNPAKLLSKYANRNGEIPEVLGKGSSKFSREGDDIVKTLGFDSSEEAREAYQQYVKDRTRLREMIEEVRSHTKEFQDTKAILRTLKEEIADEIKLKETTRLRQVKMVKEFFSFTDQEFNKLLKKGRFQDTRLYTDTEWDDFMKKLQGEGEAMFRAIERRVELKSLIYERDFKKVDNLFKAMSLPPMENMTEKQLRSMIEVLETFKQGDEFLGVRQLQTVKNTDLKNIKTVREALEDLSKRSTTPIEELQKITYKELDDYRYDSALARQNPFYKVMVDEKNAAFIQAGENIVKIRTRLNELTSAARKSRKRGFKDKFIPTDDRIFKWLESDALGKMKMSEEMTAEEIEAGVYIKNLYEQARDYLVQGQVLKQYRQDYITHIRRGFLESWKDDGLVQAFRESLNQYKQDEAIMTILDQKTGTILPLEKFFQFSMRRTGGMTPSKNVAQAVQAYFTTFERKVALDSLIPKVEIYAHSLSPRLYTAKGVEMDETLKFFVKKWINSKKGRVERALIKPGGKIDWAVRTGVALTRMIDLGFSVPTGIAAFGGEQVATFTGLGARKITKGSARMLTKKGQRILKANEAFIGESTFTKLRDQANTPGDKLLAGMFAFFNESARTANAQWLLGSLSKEEFLTGNISPTRLAELRGDMGRYRVVEQAESIMGKTAIGKVGTQYKSWAIPIISTTIDNLVQVKRVLQKDGVRAVMKRRELHELLRGSILTSTIALSMGSYAHTLQDKKDKNFAETIVAKAYRDSLTMIGALDPTLFTSEPRLLAFVSDLTEALTTIVTFEDGLLSPKSDLLESGKNAGKNKGVTKFFQTITPKFISQFLATPAKSTTKKGGLDSLDNLDNLDKLDALDELDSLDNLDALDALDSL